MRRLVFLFFASASFGIAGFSCNHGSDAPATETLPKDISDTQMPLFAYGGDPRGTYYPNTPLTNMTGNISSSVDVVNPTKNTGTGKLIFEGATATSGTFRTQNLTLSFDGLLKYRGSIIPPTQFSFDELNAFLNLGGRWERLPDRGVVVVWNYSKGYDFYYTSDSVGFYIYDSPRRDLLPPGNSILVITAFKKQR